MTQVKKILCLGLAIIISHFVNAQTSCDSNYISNGNLETNVNPPGPTLLEYATGWNLIWPTTALQAFLYPENRGDMTATGPTPVSGNYISCFISNQDQSNAAFRCGMRNKLTRMIAKNTGSYILSFEVAITSTSSGYTPGAEIAVYGLYNPTDAFSRVPTGSHFPPNLDLYGRSVTVLLGIVKIPNYNGGPTGGGTKTKQTISFDTNWVANGITHIFITHSDTKSNSRGYVAFDNFCLVKKP